MKTFEEIWAAEGRQYGEEEMEGVRLGWEMRERAGRDARIIDPPITFDIVLRGVVDEKSGGEPEVLTAADMMEREEALAALNAPQYLHVEDKEGNLRESVLYRMCEYEGGTKDVEEIIALCREGWIKQVAFDASARDPGYWGWLQTYTGKKFFPLQPELYEVDLLDLAHGASIEPRFGGQTEEPYPVTQHCGVVADIVRDVLGRPDLEFEALGHDLAEGLLKDLPRDIKLALGDAYKERMEHPLERHLAEHFGFQYPWDPVIKQADNIALMTERRDLFRCVNHDWVCHVKPLERRIVPLKWYVAESQYLDRFRKLWADRKAGLR